jgi:DNA polymerase-1
VDWLKRFLPLLGVWQVSSEGQEADDVIASLVRGRLDGQRNLIVSNDRDFMQLVSMTTNVLVPAVGPGKEKVCTPDVVEADYGVTPAQMLHLRALGGDASDNIPGAPGCGNKTASKLLRLYGTVDCIFQSNLAGLSPVLCEKLRGAEKQVRLNLLLMALGTGLDLVLSPPNIDPLAAGNGLDDIRMNPTRVFTAFFGQRFEEAT